MFQLRNNLKRNELITSCVYALKGIMRPSPSSQIDLSSRPVSTPSRSVTLDTLFNWFGPQYLYLKNR